MSRRSLIHVCERDDGNVNLLTLCVEPEQGLRVDPRVVGIPTKGKNLRLFANEGEERGTYPEIV